MNACFDVLCSFEKEHLLEVLRSDLRRSIERSKTDKENKYFHLLHARQTLRLLEALNPKRRQRPLDEQKSDRGDIDSDTRSVTLVPA